MKKSLLTLALLASFAHAQVQAQTLDSTSGSNSQAGAVSGSASGISANNSGNVSATGNENASRSQSASQSGAVSGSQSGALGNNLTMNNYAPEVQTILQDLKATNSSTSTNSNNNNSTLKSTENVNYTGGTRSDIVNSGTVTNRIEYSGTQTIKNVPSIAMSGPASGPCTGVSGGLSLVAPGGGLGFNGSAVMADCRLRENARVLGMGMQSLDGAANPQEKGELTVLFMESMRALAAYNRQIAAEAVEKAK